MIFSFKKNSTFFFFSLTPVLFNIFYRQKRNRGKFKLNEEIRVRFFPIQMKLDLKEFEISCGH